MADYRDSVGSCLTAEVSASAVGENISQLRGCLKEGTKLCAAVKADCYGHGLATLLDVIAREADSLAVATPAEAIELRRMGYGGEVLVFSTPGACSGSEAIEALIARNVTFTVASESEVPAISQAAAAVGTPARVHVKIDTGMNRSGVPAEKAAALVRLIREQGDIRLEGLYTHFATADEADKTFARRQFNLFEETVEKCGPRENLTLHTANTAAIIDLPETHLDMVRAGIGVYGYQPSGEMLNHLPLRPSLRLTGPIMQIKTVPAGSKCGYGLTHEFTRTSRIGLVPIGYADGYFRSLSNRSVVRVAGCDSPLCGRVSMDQIIIDLTDIPDAEVGDEVEIISPRPDAPNSVESLARLAGTIPYEVTCRLGPRITRTAVD